MDKQRLKDKIKAFTNEFEPTSVIKIQNFLYPFDVKGQEIGEVLLELGWRRVKIFSRRCWVKEGFNVNEYVNSKTRTICQK
jgi:hypothetical protein